MKTILLLNGPNLNLLGKRQPEHYGYETLADVEALARANCPEGFEIAAQHSNWEGQLIDWIHEAGQLHARGALAGVILNAGAYTHTSIALMDAIKGTGVALLELHISNVFAPDAFRHHSYLSPVARAVMCGLGVQGYVLAVEAVAQW